MNRIYCFNSFYLNNNFIFDEQVDTVSQIHFNFLKNKRHRGLSFYVPAIFDQGVSETLFVSAFK